MSRVPLATLLLVLTTLSCDTRDSIPTEPESPLAQEYSQAVLTQAEHFFFLPPLAADPIATGEFDPSFLPYLTVSICELSGDACAGHPIAEYSSEGSGQEALRIDYEDEHYIANWRVKKSYKGKTYRIGVYAGAVEFGYADFEVDKQAAGRVVPVRFRVEKGIPGAAPIGAEGGEVTSDDGRATFSIPAGAISETVLITAIVTDESNPDVPATLGLTQDYSIELGPAGLVPAEPIAVRWEYADLLGAFPPGVGAENLGVVLWSESVAFPEVLPVELDESQLAVSFEVPHFSLLGYRFWVAAPWAVFDVQWDIPELKWYIEGTTSYLTEQYVLLALQQWEEVVEELSFSDTQEASRETAQLVFMEKATGVCDPDTEPAAGETLLGQACFKKGLLERHLEENDKVEIVVRSGLTGGGAFMNLRHEIGHAIGIAHPWVEMSGTLRPIMQQGYFSRPHLHSWDIAAAQYHYGTAEAKAVLRWDTGVEYNGDANRRTDFDIHIWDDQGNHAFYGDQAAIPGAVIDVDNVWGFGPETFTIQTVTSSFYIIKVNYYYGAPGADSPTEATVDVIEDGSVVTRGPHEFVEYDYNGANPNAWWDAGTFFISAGSSSIAAYRSAEISIPEAVQGKILQDMRTVRPKPAMPN